MYGNRHIENVALVGFMGTGKSTVGRRLAQMLEFLLVDADHMIERAAGKPITEIFEKDGELRFREYEFEILESIQKMKNTVISTGGGLVVPPQNMELLKQNCLVVCLWASPEKIWSRVAHQSHRPLLRTSDPMETIRELLNKRKESYCRADVMIHTDFRLIKEVAQQACHHFQAARRIQEKA